MKDESRVVHALYYLFNSGIIMRLEDAHSANTKQVYSTYEHAAKIYISNEN